MVKTQTYILLVDYISELERENRGRHDNDENNHCWSSRTCFSTDHSSFVICCNIVMIIILLTYLVICRSLYIIVMGFARGRSTRSARSDPQHPRDAMGLHAVYRIAAGRWAVETILCCIHYIFCILCGVYTIRYWSTGMNPSSVRAQLLSIIRRIR